MSTPETNLFTPHTLQGIQLRNRFVRSATLEAMCDLDGHPTASLIDCYRQLAAGSCGLLISGFTYVAQSGKPLGEPVAWRGPIVMNTQEELQQAFEEYRNDTFIKHD